MPYIPAKDRDELDDYGRLPVTPGELNYAITDMIDSYLLKDKLSYAALNEVIGVLACCQHELYRRIAAPYEDLAMLRNGDVYSRVPQTPLEQESR